MNPADKANVEWWEWLWSLIELCAFFGVFVAIGIEFVAHFAERRLSRKLHDAAELEVAQIKNDNLQLSLQVEKERKERLTLEQIIGPRKLPVPQLMEIGKRLEGVKKVPLLTVDVGETGKRETGKLALNIGAALGMSGWSVKSELNNDGHLPIADIDLEITSKLQPSDALTAAQAIAAAITDVTKEPPNAGLKVEIVQVGGRVPEGTIRIRVGPKAFLK